MCCKNCGAGTSKRGAFGFERGRSKLEGGGGTAPRCIALARTQEIGGTQCGNSLENGNQKENIQAEPMSRLVFKGMVHS